MPVNIIALLSYSSSLSHKYDQPQLATAPHCVSPYRLAPSGDELGSPRFFLAGPPKFFSFSEQAIIAKRKKNILRGRPENRDRRLKIPPSEHLQSGRQEYLFFCGDLIRHSHGALLLSSPIPQDTYMHSHTAMHLTCLLLLASRRCLAVPLGAVQGRAVQGASHSD